MHAIARVEHPAANAVRHGLAIHKRSHADALHNARYMDMHTSHATLLHRNLSLIGSRVPLQPQALLGGGAGELAVFNAAQAQ